MSSSAAYETPPTRKPRESVAPEACFGADCGFIGASWGFRGLGVFCGGRSTAQPRNVREGAFQEGRFGALGEI